MQTINKPVGKTITTTGLFLMAIIGGCGDENTETKRETTQRTAAAIGMTLDWQINDSGLVKITLKAPTTGWAAVGFDANEGMDGANILIGYVGSDGVATVSDEYGTSFKSHASDISLGGQSDVSNVTGFESDGIVQLMFSIPLDSQDPFDKPLVEGQSYKLILAYGAQDDTTSYHSERTTIDIVL